MPEPRAVADYVEAYARVAQSNRRSLERLAILLRRLRERGVDCLLLKGADLVTRVYPAGARGIGDVDLWAREEDLPAIDAVARGLGLAPKIDGNAAYIDAEGSFPLDVHSSIWYLRDDAELRRRAVEREVLGAPARALEATDAMLFMCAWVCLHRAWLSATFAQDVAELARRERVDWGRLAAEADRHGLRLPLHRALEYALEKRPGALPSGVLESLAPRGLAERAGLRLLRRLVTEERLCGLGHLLVLLTRPPGSRLFALAAAFFPGERFLSYRYGERAGTRWLTRLARPLILAGQAAVLLARLARRLVGL